MSVLDYFNNGMGSQGLATQQDYQPNQYNALGKSLSPTPTGNPITVDTDNDQRNSQQFKQQALQAQQDTAGAYDTSNKIVGSSGYHYAKIDDSRVGQARSAAMAFADGYFSHMGDQGQATAAGALAASQSVSNHVGALKRQSLIQDLESKGYNPIDIDKWIQTGDTKDLITNKGSWTSDGKGYMHNTLTGEVKQIPNYQEQQKLTKVNLGDRVAFVDEQGNEVKSLATGIKPGSTSTGTDGGDIGLDDLEHDSSNMVITDPDGTKWQVAVNSQGTPQIDKKTGMATVYNPQTGETSSRVYNPTYTQQSGQISTEGLNSIQDLRSSGLLHNTGSGWVDRAKRYEADAEGKNYTQDIQSKFDTINDQIHAYAVNKLIQEGVRPTEELIRAEMRRYGHLDINNSRKQNLSTLDKMEGAFNSGYHQADTHATHTDMKNTDYSSPGSVAPTGSAAATKARNNSVSVHVVRDPKTGKLVIQ